MSIYVDIGIGALLAIALIVGVIRGFAKQFSRGICGFIGLIGAIGLTILIMPFLQKQGTLNGFATSASGWFSSEAFTTTVTSKEELDNLLSSGFLKILSTLSERIWTAMSEQEMTTLGQYFGDMCARIIVGIVIWIVLLLVFKLIFWGIRKLLEKLAQLPVLRTLDKIFGALWTLALAYIVIVSFVITAVEIVVIKWLPNFQPMLQEIVENSVVFQVLHDTNIIGSYIAQLLGVDLATLAPMA